MPSRAEVRGTVEGVLRAVSFVLLAWMLWLSLDRSRPDTVVSARSANLPGALRGWSNSGIAPNGISVQLDSTPSRFQRDWMRALKAAGSRVTWSGDLPANAIDVQSVKSPRGGFNVRAAAPGGKNIRLSDEVGSLDSGKTSSGGARFTIPSASGVIRARVDDATATATFGDSVRLRRVLVIGGAGWESKFVAAALEESGWKVDAQMRVAPGANVSQGSIAPMDTARYSAVVALDRTAAAFASDIVRYVASGGGLVLAGPSASVEAFASLRPGTAGRTVAGGVVSSEPGALTLASVSLMPIASLRTDAITLDRRDGLIAAAARRHVAGRVIQIGYTDTWRWRMGGGDQSLDDHRAWWTKIVSSVAYAPTILSITSQGDNAPMADLIGSLGPAQRQQSSLAGAAGSVSLWLLFVALSFCLLAEWASRRLRGVR